MSAIVSTPVVLSSRVAVRGARATAPKAAVRGFASKARSTLVVRASYDAADPAPEVVETPKPDMKTSIMNAMSFGGWAPELINGRVAQIAFVAGLGAELSTGQSFTAQFSEHVGSIVFASGLITLASFMPNMQNAEDYSANPASLKSSGGPWTIDAERTNGRGAMVGLVSMLILEKVIGGPITGIFASSNDELLSNTFYDESFKNEVAAVAPPAAPASGFVDFYAADAAPAAAPAVDAEAAYAAAEAAEPLRVEGVVDTEVEAQAMELGRQVSAAEDAVAAM